MSSSAVPHQHSPLRSRQSSTTVLCFRCQEVCRGEVVRVQNVHFHVKCFTCQVCGCDLARSGFFQKNEEYICTTDYQRLYGTRCDSCGDFITGEVVSALGRAYHPKCFVCSVCRKPFPIGDRVTFSGKQCICQQCSLTLVSEPVKIHGPSYCAGCQEEIKQGQSLLALEKQWHVSCFKCQTCGTVLTGEYISKDGVPYCESDYHAQFGIKCNTCNRYISGRVLEAGGKHYHPTCARCARCRMMFTEGEEMYLTGSEVWHPLCKQAARAEKKLKHRRASEASISPPGSSIGSPSRVICAKLENEIFKYKDYSSLAKSRNVYDAHRASLSSHGFGQRYASDDGLERFSYGESFGTLSPYSQDIYSSVELRRRRSSSPGYIDSPTYSRQGMSPSLPRSPLHYYRSGNESGRSSPYYSAVNARAGTPTTYQAPKHFHVPDTGETNIYRKPPIYKRHGNHQRSATKGKASEDILQSPQFPAPYYSDHYQHGEPEYYHYASSPKGPRARRFSSGGEDDSWNHSLNRIQSGIGRMILKEEMKARSGCYDNDPWASARNSRSSSRETLHNVGYNNNTVNGCEGAIPTNNSFLSKSASLPGYGRNGLHRPQSADYFEYVSGDPNWGIRDYRIYPYKALIVSARGINRLPSDVDRARLEGEELGEWSPHRGGICGQEICTESTPGHVMTFVVFFVFFSSLAFILPLDFCFISIAEHLRSSGGPVLLCSASSALLVAPRARLL
ncbi:actin-binding LIM protein 3-like isoform X5 [Scleropages formosus]|uniref:actin-binding LIM protein 3-like isoform X5 n=1 Tax=Scleropages formosus TaxID=113540 RepID=UPI0010FA7221|nr:actin-binding LIM protein 3-like isoform X5 [Scleropages formosus]